MVAEDRDEALLKVAASLFARHGRDGRADLSLEECAQMLESHLMDEYCKANNIDIHDVGVVFQLLDENSCGSVKLSEFMDGCLRLPGTAKSADVAKVRLQQMELNQCMRELNSSLDAEMVAIK